MDLCDVSLYMEGLLRKLCQSLKKNKEEKTTLQVTDEVLSVCDVQSTNLAPLSTHSSITLPFIITYCLLEVVPGVNTNLDP